MKEKSGSIYSRRKFLGGVAAAVSLAGCTSNGSDQKPVDTVDNSTPTPDNQTTPGNKTRTTPDPAETPQNNTETPENSTETPEEKTREKKNPGPSYDNLEQVINNELIGNDVAAFIDTHWEEIGGYLENKDYNSQNPELTENFIETVLTACSEVPWNPDQNTGAQASAHILYNKLDVSPDDVLVAARTRNDAGHPTPITSILTQTTGPKNGYKKYLYQHRENEHAAKGTGDYSGAKPEGDNSLLLSPSEKPTSITEKAFADMWNPKAPSIISFLDKDGIESRAEYRVDSSRHNVTDSVATIQEGIGKLNDNLVVGANFEDEAEISYTNDAFEVVSEVLDFNNINNNPGSVGSIAHDLVSEASMFFYNNVNYDEDAYMEIDYTGDADADPTEYEAENFEFSLIGIERKEELEGQLMEDMLSRVIN